MVYTVIMAISRKPDQSDDEKLGLEINNGDYRALKVIKDKFGFRDEEAALRFALAVLTQTNGDTVYIEDESGNKVGLQPSDSLRRPSEDGTSK
jgi:hypothetical protein